MRQTTSPSRIVYTADVRRDDEALEETTARTALETLTRTPVESCADDGTPAVQCTYHPLIAGLQEAYDNGYPLVLSPSMFWLLLAQGFAQILNDDPEALRAWFVGHTGQLELRVRRDEFVRGRRSNGWPGVFTEFSALIRSHVGADNHDALVTSFSTRELVEKAANEVALLDAMQNYFGYVMDTLGSPPCGGIPEIRLQGTPQDWAHLAERAANLGRRYECDWWIRHVTPWLERMHASAAGAPDPELWTSIYTRPSDDSPDPVGGWIVQLFPFLRGPEGPIRNRYLGDDLLDVGVVGVMRDGELVAHITGVENHELPSSLSKVPFLWLYGDEELRMEFLAGFTHCTQDPTTLAIRPAIGWAVRPA